MTTICVDVMGSDCEPSVLLEGVAKALELDSELKVLVAGDASVVEPFARDHERAEALVTTEVIAMDEHPASAVRKKKDASIVRAASAVRAGQADGLFSAGSTGAVLTAATFGIGRIKGIRRPALTLAAPGISGKKTVLLDCGAYAQVVLGVEEPRVALLCNGSEDTKGSELALSYHKALAEGNCGFVGNAEGTDLLAGTFDVIVADGFTGNVALKTIEGTAKFIVSRVKAAAGESKRAGLGALMLKPALKTVAGELSGDEMGGAVLLGLRAPVVKGHGSTSAEAVASGTLACARAARGQLCERIAKACEKAE